MINIKISIPKELPIQKLNQYVDDVVFFTARATLDFTNSKHHFPYLTGELNRASMVEGVVKEKRGTYHLGARGVNYSPAVWKYPQKTNWTNPDTYAQWYIKEFDKDKEIITQRAISQAKGKLK